jgi:hypothetical protein
MKLIYVILFGLLAYSCENLNSGEPLKGKIIARGIQDSNCYIYVNSEKPIASFIRKKDKESEYSGFTWLNTRDSFIGNEMIFGESTMYDRDNIALFDQSGKLIDRIYQAKSGEMAWPLYSSLDDKYYIFTTHRFSDPTCMLSLIIMNLNQKKIIRRIDNIGNDFEVNESPWLHGGYRFVYSMAEYQGKEVNPILEPQGVYLFDIVSGERNMLIPGGSDAVVSPTKNEIAYQKDNSIRIMDLNSHKDRIIYNHSSHKNIMNMHWTPDGRYIYFYYRYEWEILFNAGDKLIDAKTGKSKPFKNTAIGFNYFSWK